MTQAVAPFRNTPVNASGNTSEVPPIKFIASAAHWNMYAPGIIDTIAAKAKAPNGMRNRRAAGRNDGPDQQAGTEGGKLDIRAHLKQLPPQRMSKHSNTNRHQQHAPGHIEERAIGSDRQAGRGNVRNHRHGGGSAGNGQGCARARAAGEKPGADHHNDQACECEPRHPERDASMGQVESFRFRKCGPGTRIMHGHTRTKAMKKPPNRVP